MVIKIANALIAIVAGVGGALLLYYVLNKLVEMLPQKMEERIKPFVFIGPAFAAITLFLLYPAVRTIILSFADRDSEAFVGISNYTELLASSNFRSTLLNTLLWIAIVPAVTVVLGLGVAVLADRLSPRAEKLSKTIIFLPMAISMVGAGTIWRFVYEARPPGRPQIGLQNGIITALGFDPVVWLQESTLHLNSFLLMVILIWAQVGFSMVLLSAAVKGVPTETLEAARIDGANEKQAFFRVVVPQIWATVITVFITVTIGVMKVFDIVYVMTNGNFNTNVIALDFYNQLFTNGNAGYASAIVVMLMIAVLPIMIYQVRHFRAPGGQLVTSVSTGVTPTAVPGPVKERTAMKGAGGAVANQGKANWVVKVALIVICFLWVVPIIGLLITSLRQQDAANSSGWWTVIANPLDFTQWTLQNYSQVATESNMLRAFVNSFAVTLPATIIPIMIAAFAAYAFSFMEFPGRDVLFIIIVSLLVIPSQVALVPLLQLYGTFGINGEFVAVWLAHIGFGMPLAVYILRNYMSTLPKELVESAKMDGASHFQTFWKLIIPVSTPALASFAIFQFLWVWNDLLVALLFLGPGDNEPMTVNLAGLVGQQGQGWQLITAGGFFTMAVPLLVFLSLQRYFVRGMTAGSVKG